MSDQLLVEGHSPSKPEAAPVSTTKAPDPITNEKAPEREIAEAKSSHLYSEETKKEVYSIAEKILAAAADKSSGETEKKLIAAVMAVHMKYAESLHVIENLIQDRKKIDDRVKFLEGQLKKGGKGVKAMSQQPPAYATAPKSRTSASSKSPKKGNENERPSKAKNTEKSAGKKIVSSSPRAGDDENMPSDFAAVGGGDESGPPPEGEEQVNVPSRHAGTNPAHATADDSDCEDELFVIGENQEITGEEMGLPPAYNSKMKQTPRDPIRSRKSEIKARLAELYELPPETRGATPRSSATVGEAFPIRPQTAPHQTSGTPRRGSDAGSPFRPSTASTTRFKKMSLKDEIESLEQELYEIEQKLRFQRASKVGPAEFKGMKERDEMMRKRAEDRLEKSLLRAEAAEKAREEEQRREEDRATKRMARASKSSGIDAVPVDENGNPIKETWEERLEREKKNREDRKLKHKAAVLANRAPLTKSLEESINVFKETKGKFAPEPPKIKIIPTKATDPATVAARIAREAEKLEAAKIEKEKANEIRIRNLAVAPDHPSVVKMRERADETRLKAEQRAAEIKKKEDDAKAAKDREEKEKYDTIKAQKVPDIKPTNAQISRDMEVKRAEEARIEEQKRKAKIEQERIERQEAIQRNLLAAKHKETNRVVLGEEGKPVDTKRHPSLADRFEKYHKPHLH